MELGLIGLGRMGANMSRRWLRGGHAVVGYARHAETVAGLVADGALSAGAASLEDLVSRLAVIAALPFGGIKQSGINRYHGQVGLRLFSNIKGMVIGDGKQDTEAYWFPHGHESLQAVKDSLR